MSEMVRTDVPLTEPARFRFDSEQIAVLRRTVAKDCNDSEFVVFLEIVGRYSLDPWAKEVYAAKMPGANGSPGAVTMIVARDGLLAIANRSGEFNGMTCEVVRQGDTYSRFPDGTYEHSWQTSPEARAAEPIVGAWASVEREGRRPTYFFAPFASYKTNNKTWSKYPDAMILKVAQSMALRQAFSISGVVGEDEVAGQLAGESAPSVDQEPEYGPEPFGSWLRSLFDMANELRPGAFLPQKQRVALAGVTQTRREQMSRELMAFITKHGGEPPPEPVEGEAVVVADPEVEPEGEVAGDE